MVTTIGQNIKSLWVTSSYFKAYSEQGSERRGGNKRDTHQFVVHVLSKQLPAIGTPG